MGDKFLQYRELFLKADVSGSGLIPWSALPTSSAGEAAKGETRYDAQTTFAALSIASFMTATTAYAIGYSEADINEDGYVSMDECNDVMPDAEGDVYEEIDTDQDDEITETEWNSAIDAGLIPSN